VTSNEASLTVRIPLAITSQPSDQSTSPGGSVYLSVSAVGNNLSYQWKKDGEIILGATNSYYYLYGVRSSYAGDYTVDVSDSVDTVTSRTVKLTVIEPVSIVSQPTNVTADLGGSATFGVTATGGALTYQWAKEGVNILGATAETLDLSEIKSSDEGDYTVLVSNGQDDETSNPARLTVIGPAAINVQPTNIAVGQGGNAIFSVGATGGSLSYQWQRNGVDIEDATEATLELSNVQESDLGDYSVIVENSEGSVTSNTVSLTLTDYEYNENEDGSGITLSRYIGPAGDVTIPTTIAGYTVTSIGEYAFTEYGDSITRVVVPNTVTRIEEGAFAGCTALTSIVIPDSVTWIGDYAFADCLSLTDVTIPDSVTSIGQEAFSGCDGLSKVDLPDRFLTQLSKIGLPGQLATTILTEGMSKLLSNHEGFIAALAGEILSKADEYGFAAKSDLATLATKEEIADLATKSELTTALSESKTAGINSVLSNPNLWTLYTTSQIQNMAVGDLVLTKNIGGTYTLNYDIEQSSDLKNWTSYRVKAEELTGLPTDKAFVRIKVK
jgi:hypothetical protein